MYKPKDLITFEDIMTKGIIFFDEEYKEECKNFCQIRNINYLPKISSDSYCYFFNSETSKFTERKIKEDQMVGIYDDIYHMDLVKAFKKYEVLFGMYGRKVKGVIHFSDYNRSPVYTDIYSKLYNLERGLVNLVVEFSGLSKYELLHFLEKEKSDKHKKQRLEHEDFRGKNITLKTILEFVEKQKLIKIRQPDINQIIALRNMIAHSNNLISAKKADHNLYDVGSYSRLLSRCISLEVALRQVSNRLYLMDSALQEDFSQAVISIDERYRRTLLK